MDVDAQIATLNKKYFGANDVYSDTAAVRKTEKLVKEDGGKVVAYLIFKERKRYYEGLRSATAYRYRRKGLAAGLYRQLVMRAKVNEKPYKTYAAKRNLASINAHIRAGMLIKKIGMHWVYLTT